MIVRRASYGMGATGADAWDFVKEIGKDILIGAGTRAAASVAAPKPADTNWPLIIGGLAAGGLVLALVLRR